MFQSSSQILPYRRLQVNVQSFAHWIQEQSCSGLTPLLCPPSEEIPRRLGVSASFCPRPDFTVDRGLEKVTREQQFCIYTFECRGAPPQLSHEVPLNWLPGLWHMTMREQSVNMECGTVFSSKKLPR